MIDLKALFEKRKINHFLKKENIKKLCEYLLKCPNIKDAIKHIDTLYLEVLEPEVFEIPVEGYMNLYDYLINTKEEKFKPKGACFERRNIYIPHILKYKNFTGINRVLINSKMLLDTLPNGERIIDFILKNNKDFPLEEAVMVDSLEVAEILYKSNCISHLRGANLEVLTSKIDNDKTVLDVLKENNLVPLCRFVKETNSRRFSAEEEVIKIFNDNLGEKVGNKLFLEILIEKGFNFNIEYDAFANSESREKLAAVLATANAFNRMKTVTEDFLLIKVQKDNQQLRVIDILKDDELPNIITKVKDNTIIKRYLNAKKYSEIIICLDEATLLQEIEKNVTVLDYIIKNASSPNELLRATQIISQKNLLTPDVSLIFSKYEYYIKSEYDKKTGIKSDEDLYTFIYDDELNYQLDKESKKYISFFKKLYNDGESSKEAIELAIKSFKRTYAIDKELAKRDLDALIKLKIKYPFYKLSYNKTNGSSFAAPEDLFGYPVEDAQLTIDNKYNIEVYNHELGHLVHYYYDDGNTPKNIEEVLEKVQISDAECKKIFDEINKEAEEQLESEEEYQKMYDEFIIKKYQSIENYHQVIKSEFKKLYGTKELVLEAINDGTYSKEVLKALVDIYFEQKSDIDNNLLINLYVENRIREEKNFFKETVYRKKNIEFLCYENFIDAYYKGNIGSYRKKITKEERENIKAPMCTHDADYFILPNMQFKELYANYMALKKAPKGKVYIEKLKEKTSLKLIELIEEYDKKLKESSSAQLNNMLEENPRLEINPSETFINLYEEIENTKNGKSI